jgi:membrane protein YqaA with SNARE-associated domain
MKTGHSRRNFSFTIFFVLFISLSIYLIKYSTPESLVNFIGVSNAYLILFFLAFIGALTAGGLPYHLVLIAFSTTGLSPLFLGLSVTMGVILADITAYYIGYHGGFLGPESFQRFFRKVYERASRHPKVLPVFCFIYGACIPFSNDVITISAGIARHSFWRVIIPLGLGNFVFNVSIAFLGLGIFKIIEIVFSFLGF